MGSAHAQYGLLASIYGKSSQMAIKVIACACVCVVQSPFAELLGADADSDAGPDGTEFTKQWTEAGAVT